MAVIVKGTRGLSGKRNAMIKLCALLSTVYFEDSIIFSQFIQLFYILYAFTIH